MLIENLEDVNSNNVETLKSYFAWFDIKNPFLHSKMTFLEGKFTYVQMHNDLYVETEIPL